VLSLKSLQVGRPGPDEVKIHQTFIGVNFIDIYCRTGYFPMVPTPHGILWMEAVGEIVEVGEEVSEFREGDRVGYACVPPGAYCSHRNMPEDRLVQLPQDLPDELAASLLLKGFTASFLLHEVIRFKSGDWILIHAAAGGVGSLLSQWAKAKGAQVIGTVSNSEKARIAREQGCDHTVIYTQENFVESVRQITSDEGVSVVFDAVGKDNIADSIEALRPCGQLVSFG
jgi:NADPH2:quinone reductase